MTHSNSDQRLASIVQRIERLAEEKRGLTSDIADIYKEAAGSGYDKKALRALIRERAQDADEVKRINDEKELMLAALGGLADMPLGTAAMGKI